MEYYTLLVITILSGPFEGSQSYLLYESYDQCFEHHQTVAFTLPYDYRVTCEVTDVPSASVKPKRNPRYE